MTLHRAQEVQTITIASSGTTSEAIAASGAALFGMLLPGTLTSTTCTFTVCDTATGTFLALYDSTGTIVASTTVAASHAIDLPTQLAAFPFFKVVMGSSEGAARTIKIVTKG